MPALPIPTHGRRFLKRLLRARYARSRPWRRPAPSRICVDRHVHGAITALPTPFPPSPPPVMFISGQNDDFDPTTDRPSVGLLSEEPGAETGQSYYDYSVPIRKELPRSAGRRSSTTTLLVLVSLLAITVRGLTALTTLALLEWFLGFAGAGAVEGSAHCQADILDSRKNSIVQFQHKYYLVFLPLAAFTVVPWPAGDEIGSHRVEWLSQLKEAQEQFRAERRHLISTRRTLQQQQGEQRLGIKTQRNERLAEQLEVPGCG
ncbi:Delta-9 fatty acid desaturase protein [Mycena chlorophos]|uniref:Delta-9 fatty acid desaturase protein n=1 Tax=Mycena chlorophos TaxID=658473 RepID=A0A8H6W7A7_MYCCL|nr:Delta-9 fatty acid desaturase protein [Mycena chlorophos]